MSSLIGFMLGRYQILEQLGVGGMATVYKAQDTLLERYVAIKVIRPDQFAPAVLDEVRKRFEREAKALAKLSHPNIVHVHDYGEFEAAPYLVMEYVSGGTLKERSEKQIPWLQSVQLLLPIAYALAYAHEQNIVHRDIKPANILLTAKNTPMLSDFGIAKILQNKDGSTLTNASVIIGTPEYMAPEQWTGETSPKSDIYSLGVVLYELVTGRKPYVADTPMSVMLKQMNEPLPRPSQFVRDLPKGLESVLFKALERRPEDRYQSMNEFAAALETLLRGQTLSAKAKANTVPADKTVVAKGGIFQGVIPAPSVVVDHELKPSTGRNRDAAVSPGEQALPSAKMRRWIPVGLVTVLLCIGLAAGGAWAYRSVRGNIPLTGTLGQGSGTTEVAAQTPVPSTSAFSQGSPHAQVNVLWDTSHGPRAGDGGSLYAPDGMYKSLTQALNGDNFIVKSGNLSDLSGYDIVVISERSGTTPYDLAEANRIEQFVRRSGHAVLILSDSPAYENLAYVVAGRFSIGLGELTSGGTVSPSNGPFFSGVSSISFVNGGGIFQVSSPAQTAAVDQNGNSVIAFCNCGEGRVVAISDASLWDNHGIKEADNQRFALDVFQWLAKLSP